MQENVPNIDKDLNQFQWMSSRHTWENYPEWSV